MGGWIAYIPLVVTLILTLVSHFTLRTAERFDAEGIETVGTVLGRDIRVSHDSDGDETRSYFVKVRFTPDGSAPLTVEQNTDAATHDRSAIGTPVTLWYLASEPDTIELSRGETRTASAVTQGIALVFGTIFLAALWVPARRAIAALRARRYGARERAVVTEHLRTHITVNSRRLYRLAWRDERGREGKSLPYRRDILRAFPEGSRISIYQGLTKAWWEGDVGPRDPRT
ncbi:hypothetical protein SSE37_07503 [Sagittula stellata E-37]|uniref:DUF3592 domain-containing protein n=2 Tax=Sagittula stellata TaxID=52603 RepID=A3JYT2_SAGS3|nr:hypothetical protein SSE37_07503 [Sagittula stellata E-37]